MAHSYIAYIDESGDDGLSGNYRQVGTRGGSSQWLTISASVWRYSLDADAVSWRNEIRSRLGSQAQKKPLHYKHLGHNQRLMAAQILAEKPLRSICVSSYKPLIPAETYCEKNQLYFYMSRYVLERLSWLCREFRPRVPEGDGRVKIVFSRRGGMSYGDFRDYMNLLRIAEDPGISINWAVIDIDAIEAVDHSQRAGLQIADLVASSITAGLEADIYGNCEKRYAEVLKPRMYYRKGNYLSYGVKLVPRWEKIPLTKQQMDFVELFLPLRE
jgi:hypothetical protein